LTVMVTQATPPAREAEGLTREEEGAEERDGVSWAGDLGNWPEENWNTNWACRIPRSVLGYSQIDVDWFWSLITRFLANLTFDFYNKYGGMHASKPMFMIFYSRFHWCFFLF